MAGNNTQMNASRHQGACRKTNKKYNPCALSPKIKTTENKGGWSLRTISGIACFIRCIQHTPTTCVIGFYRRYSTPDMGSYAHRQNTCRCCYTIYFMD